MNNKEANNVIHSNNMNNKEANNVVYYVVQCIQ